jgi:pimeloyl-ACP methyl ester carboxylesterase
MPARQGAVQSDGASIHYLDWGPPTAGRSAGPALVLIHATGFLAGLWRPIAERLSNQVRVVAFDQRGHGDSDTPASGYAFETFAADLQRVIEGLELERPILAGHSSGGTTIVAHAALHPGGVSRAVLIEPILPLPEWFTEPPAGRSALSLAEGARKRRAVWPDRETLYEAYRGRETFSMWREDVLRLYVDEGTFERADGQIELKCAPEIEAQFFEAVTRIDPWPMLRHLTCPTLVVWGADGNLLGHGLVERAQEALSNARTVVVPGATHFLPQERPDDVAGLIEGFLAD